jgi:hypothetical protein
LFIFNCNWVDTRWQQYSTHLHTNSTQNTENGTDIRIKEKKIGKCGPCPVFASYTLAFTLQLRTNTEKPEKLKNVSPFQYIGTEHALGKTKEALHVRKITDISNAITRGHKETP